MTERQAALAAQAAAAGPSARRHICGCGAELKPYKMQDGRGYYASDCQSCADARRRRDGKEMG